MPVEFRAGDAPSWRQWVTSFDSAANTFARQFVALRQLGPYVRQTHPSMVAEYNALITRGAQNEARIAQLRAVRSQAASFLSTLARGFSRGTEILGIQAFTNTFQRGWRTLFSGGLGAIPLVAIGSLAAAVAAIAIVAAWIADTTRFSARLNAARRLVDSGATPGEATAQINALVGRPPSASTAFGLPWNLIVFGALALTLGPPIIKALSERKR